MGRQAAINKLPVHIQLELNERLRRSGYCAIEMEVIWLAGEGYTVSRSAVHRHCQALRAADSSLGDVRARVAEIRAKPKGTRDDLFRELGRLQLAQARILAQLQALEDNGMDLGDTIDDNERESVDA